MATFPAAPAGLHRATRLLLAAFGGLTALGLTALLVGATQTDRAFAWTIAPPLAAAFLGAAYGAGCLLVLLTLRAGTWAQARWPLVTILVFVVVTLVASLRHLDRLHLTEPGGLATAAAWFWLTVYVVLPPAMAAVLVLEERRHRPAGPAGATDSAGASRADTGQPRGFTLSLLAQAAVLGASGGALLLHLAPVVDRWPWTLTPFVAEVTAAWLLSFALAAVLAARVDVARLGPACCAYAAFGVLELTAALLHAGDLRDGPAASAYLLLAGWVAATGGWGVALARRAGGGTAGAPGPITPVHGRA